MIKTIYNIPTVYMHQVVIRANIYLLISSVKPKSVPLKNAIVMLYINMF